MWHCAQCETREIRGMDVCLLCASSPHFHRLRPRWQNTNIHLGFELKLSLGISINIWNVWVKVVKGWKWKWSRSVVSDSATPWTVAYQAPPSWDFPSKSAGVDCHFLLQGIFPTQESNAGLPHCRQILYCLSHQEDEPPGSEGGQRVHTFSL